MSVFLYNSTCKFYKNGPYFKNHDFLRSFFLNVYLWFRILVSDVVETTVDAPFGTEIVPPTGEWTAVTLLSPHPDSSGISPRFEVLRKILDKPRFTFLKDIFTEVLTSEITWTFNFCQHKYNCSSEVKQGDTVIR